MNDCVAVVGCGGRTGARIDCEGRACWIFLGRSDSRMTSSRAAASKEEVEASSSSSPSEGDSSSCTFSSSSSDLGIHTSRRPLEKVVLILEILLLSTPAGSFSDTLNFACPLLVATSSPEVVTMAPSSLPAPSDSSRLAMIVKMPFEKLRTTSRFLVPVSSAKMKRLLAVSWEYVFGTGTLLEAPTSCVDNVPASPKRDACSEELFFLSAPKIFAIPSRGLAGCVGLSFHDDRYWC